MPIPFNVATLFLFVSFQTSTQKAVTARSQVPREKLLQRVKTKMEGETSRNKQMVRALKYLIFDS